MVAFKTSALEQTDLATCDAFNTSQLLEQRVVKRPDALVVAPTSNSLRLLQVLVVDDEHDTTDVMGMLVRRWGHACQLAYDGATALCMASAVRPDIVLLDIEMPGMDGCEVARRLRRDLSAANCLIVGIMGRVDEDRRHYCDDAGFDLVLLKPVDPTVLETLLVLECTRVNRA